jgi:hypothetical protein
MKHTDAGSLPAGSDVTFAVGCVRENIVAAARGSALNARRF